MAMRTSHYILNLTPILIPGVQLGVIKWGEGLQVQLQAPRDNLKQPFKVMKPTIQAVI